MLDSKCDTMLQERCFKNNDSKECLEDLQLKRAFFTDFTHALKFTQDDTSRNN